jgi:hypothetical protein
MDVLLPVTKKYRSYRAFFFFQHNSPTKLKPFGANEKLHQKA